MIKSYLLRFALIVATVMYSTQAAEKKDFEVLAVSGGPSLLSIKKGVSINDTGWAAFTGEKMGRDGKRVENVFSVHPETKQLRSLMNPVFEHQVVQYPPLALSNGPTQIFGEFVQINNKNQVLAWRNLNATVSLLTFSFLPNFGPPMSAPMTYWETWPVNGNEGLPGKIGLPSQTVYLGWPAKPIEFKTFWTNSSQLATWPVFREIGLPNPPVLVNPLGVANYFINPVWGGEYPSKWFKSDFAAVMRYGALNNKGQVVFTVLKDGGQKAEAVVSGGNVMGTPGFNVFPAIADNGNWVARGNPTPTLYVLNNNMTSVTPVVGSEQGFAVAEMGQPNISDDGRFVAFYGNLSNPNAAAAMGSTVGPGIFIYSTTTKKVSRVAGTGYISRFATDVRPCVNNFGTCIYFGWDILNRKTLFSSTLGEESGKPRFEHPVSVVSVGDRINGTLGSIEDLSIHDSLNNTNSFGEILFWAQSQNRHAIVKAPVKRYSGVRFLDAAPVYFGAEPSMPYELVWKTDLSTYEQGYYEVQPRKDAFEQWSQARKEGLVKNSEIRGKIAADGISKVLCRVEVPSSGEATFSTDRRNAAGKPLGYFYPIDSKKGQLPIAEKLSIETKVIEIDGKQRHYAIVFFKPDENAISGEGENINISIALSFTPRDSKVETKYISELKITRPPVLLMHGLWASPNNFINRVPDCNFSEKTEEGVYRSIEKLVGAENLILGDYASSNAREFRHNLIRVEDQIDQVLNQYRESGGAISKIDYVGHSMGGILGRMCATKPGFYLHSYGNNSKIRKLITLDTPHLGASTADFRLRQMAVDYRFVAFIDKWNSSEGMPADDGAIDDLVSGSPAIRGLEPTRHDVRCHAIASDTDPADVYVWDNALNLKTCPGIGIDKYLHYADSLTVVYPNLVLPVQYAHWAAEWGIRTCNSKDSLLVPMPLRMLDPKLVAGFIPCTDLTTPESLIRTIFLGEPNDRVVSVRSQVGGIQGGPSVSTILRLGPNHTDVSGDWRAGARIAELLDSNDNSNWGKFPSAAALTSPDPCIQFNWSNNSFIQDLPKTHLNAKSTSRISRLEIAQSNNGSRYLELECILSSTNDAFFSLVFTPQLPAAERRLYRVSSGVPTKVLLPDNVEGLCTVKIKEAANGRFNVTQKDVFIGTTAKFTGLSVPKRDIVIDALGQARPLGIFGSFSDGIQRSGIDILRGAVVSIVGDGLVQIGDDGLVRGLRNGVCEVKLTRDGMSASVFMTVDAPTPKLFAAVVDGALSTKENLVVKLVGQNLNAITNIATMTNGVSDLGTRFISVQSNPSGTEAEARFAVTYGDLWRDVDLFVMNGAGKDDYEQRGGVPVSIGFGPLSIGVVNDIDGAQLVWPGLDSGFMLENSSDLSDNKKWNLCTEVYMIGNGYGKYRVSPSEAQRFFRVRKIN
jgi:pimeloyl-ACP methyl ester carboxylesterase